MSVAARCYCPLVDEHPLAPGLLVAMPHLLDPNFRRAVVLLVHHDENGTFGVVLNRITNLTAGGLCETLDLQWGGDEEDSVDWGGPVQPQTGWALFDDSIPLEDDENVTSLEEGIHFGGLLDVLQRAAGDPPENLRMLLGYAGWGPGQLESELSEGAWLVAPLRRDVVFEVDPGRMWEYVVRSLGIEPSTLVASRGIH